MFDHEFTKSLMFRDFDDVLKNPFRYVHLFHYTHYYKKIPKIALHDLSQRVQSCGANPPLNEDLALTDPVFCPTSSTYQKHLKLGQCLEIDDRRSLSKFGDVT